MHQVYAFHVGDKRTVRSEFMFRDRSQDELTISFYFWLVLGGPEPIVFDVSFDAEYAQRRGLYSYHDRTELLAKIGVAPEQVRTVVMSHLHWDHWAGHALFPNARFVVQAAEAAFWTSRAARHELVMASAAPPSLESLLRLNLDGRIEMIDGPKEMWPGLTILPAKGHTPGMQILVVETERGNVVLANDTMHFYENYEKRRPVQVTMNFPDALDSLDIVKAHAGNEDLIVAGHDPLVKSRYREISPGVYRIA